MEKRSAWQIPCSFFRDVLSALYVTNSLPLYSILTCTAALTFPSNNKLFLTNKPVPKRMGLNGSMPWPPPLCLGWAVLTYQEIPASVFLLYHDVPIIPYWIEKCIRYKSCHSILSLQMCESVSSVKTTNKRTRHNCSYMYLAEFW